MSHSKQQAPAPRPGRPAGRRRGAGKRLGRTLLTALVGTIVAGAALLLLVRLTYRSVLYPAPRSAPEPVPAGAELREHATADGAVARALVYPAHGSPRRRRALVYFHGNAETIDDTVWLGRELASRGLEVVAVEYRGYGRSGSGSPTEQGLYQDAEAVLRGLGEAGLQPADLTLWGYSLGSGVAVEMARRGHAPRLILSAPFTSVPAVAASLIPLLPARLLIGDAYDNLAKAPALRARTLIIHGDDDRLVPYHMGLELARAIPEAELFTVAGGGHGDLLLRERERLLGAVVAHAQGPPEGP